MQFTGIGKLISNLEEKTTLEDTDCLITGTSDAKKITWANVFNAISDGIKAKILEWTFTNLGTTDKTIIGAVNELNMKLSMKNINSSYTFDDLVRKNEIVIFTNWSDDANFPLLYGSGIMLPALDAAIRFFIYTRGNVTYSGTYKFNEGVTWTQL